ncbi:MAG TPA: sigma-54 dependent transcriptional regulator [Anaeromyxobacteraceae bacterium]|nr:sigma-54 dependent transcriptional regulator [Anaeromyxobacteraceae bacterium]
MGNARILIVDGNAAARGGLRSMLARRGHEVAEAEDVAGALGRLGGSDAVVVAPALRDGSAAVLVARARAAGSNAAFVVACAVGETGRAVEALRAGADGCLAGPADGELASAVLERALEARRLRRERGELREQARAGAVLVGGAPQLLAVQDVIRRAAPTKATVLILGESGTGKSVAAQALHEASPRRDGPFVRAGCAALSRIMVESDLFGHEKGAFAGAEGRADGRVAAADGGTLHLAAVESLSPASQVRLLRLLQQGEFERVGGRETLRADVRVVASTRRDLAEEVRAGRFRDDLYYRLSVVAVTMPPLRARKGDLPALAGHFLDRCRRREGKEVRGFTPGALSALFAHDWPGNVRELENVVEGAVRACAATLVGPEDLSPVLHGARPEEQTSSSLIPGATLFEIEREAILRTLGQVGGSTARAAEVLGISVRKIQYRLKEYRTGHPRGARDGQVLLASPETR